jgi:hypothetical protein
MIPFTSCIKPYAHFKGCGEIIYFVPSQVKVEMYRSKVHKSSFKDRLNICLITLSRRLKSCVNALKRSRF